MNNDSEISPGDFLASVMTKKGFSQSELAYTIDATPATINQIVKGKRGISTNMAKLLSAALGISAEDFVKVQALWDLKNSGSISPAVAARSKIVSHYPIREMIKRGWIIEPDKALNAVPSVEDQVCSFFGVSSLSEVPHLSHTAKKTDYKRIPPEQLAWLFRVKSIAEEMVVPDYSIKKLRDAIEELDWLREKPEYICKVPRILSEAGVRFVIVEGLSSGLIDGVCFWVDNKKPVVGMSLRHNRIDNFWFVLRHELSHVLHGHGKKDVMIDDDLTGEESDVEEERIANQDASEFCVPAKKMDSFFLRKKPFFADREVVAFAKRVGTHPGLVVGQLHRRMGEYNFLRRHLTPVREIISGAMMVDGWGDIIPVNVK